MQNRPMFIACAIAGFVPWGLVLYPLGIAAQVIGLTVQWIGVMLFWMKRKD